MLPRCASRLLLMASATALKLGPAPSPDLRFVSSPASSRRRPVTMAQTFLARAAIRPIGYFVCFFGCCLGGDLAQGAGTTWHAAKNLPVETKRRERKRANKLAAKETSGLDAKSNKPVFARDNGN